jgi:sucrose phosphorylase
MTAQTLPQGVMLNAYPDSIGCSLSETVNLLKLPEFEDAFSLFYILPTFFNSDLDRGFSIIDYELNKELVTPDDLVELDRLGIQIKLDLVLNHLSVRSPQFQDLLTHGDASRFRDFFIDWDEFWKDHGEPGDGGQITPHQEHLDKLFMRKPGLPTLQVLFPDGQLKTYWNTFYQKIDFAEITALDFADIDGLDLEQAEALADHIKIVITDKGDLKPSDLSHSDEVRARIMKAVSGKREYLGQMDLNARSELVWDFYDATLRKLSEYGARIIRLDAFAYLHKEPGRHNFFNRPGTWEYLQRLRGMAERYGLTVFPEIHAEYGSGIYEEIAGEGYPIYDFFLPGLLIDALDRGHGDALKAWMREIVAKDLRTINMLGCHDGIPVLDLRGKRIDESNRPGLLDDAEIDKAMQNISDRGGLTKNLYGADGKKIDYYQINATYFSALGEDNYKMLLARAIQMFMPGIPQVWYLDLFAGTNDYAAAARGRTAGHKEINRTSLSWADIEQCLPRPIVRDQLTLIRFRNTSPAFRGEMEILETGAEHLHVVWRHPDETAILKADLCDHGFAVLRADAHGEEIVLSQPPA